jgi:hypothetical protein
MRASWPVLVGVVLALGGCDKEFIEIVVTPRVDGTFDRVMRLWKEKQEGIFEKPVIIAPSKRVLAAPGEPVRGAALILKALGFEVKGEPN